MAESFDITKISDKHLLTIYHNSKIKRDVAGQSMCELEIKKRGIRTNRTKQDRRFTDLEDTVASQLLELGHSVASTFDLSEERAKSLSRGFVGFRTHRLLGRIGGKPAAKTGGPQKNGDAMIDRYISYRIRDRFISLNYILESGGDVDEGYWLLCGSGLDASTVEGAIAFVPTDKSVFGWAKTHGGIRFDDFESAASAFRAFLDREAPKKDSC